jgi:hypothetical protein
VVCYSGLSCPAVPGGIASILLKMSLAGQRVGEVQGPERK